MNKVEAHKTIRTIALESGKVVITTHANERMVERGFTHLDVLNCLEKGVVCEGPYMSQKGDWTVNMQRHAAGELLEIVVAICAPNLIIVTTF